MSASGQLLGIGGKDQKYKNTNDKSFRVHINEGEMEQIRDWVSGYDDIETGGDLFGLWLDDHTAVVQFVLGPGDNCHRQPTSFFQDVDYLRTAGSYLTKNHGLCNIGQWHSHHRIRLFEPSAGDNNMVWNNMPTLGLDKYIVFIANIKGYDDMRQVTVNCFLFRIQNGRQLPVQKGQFEYLDGNSPIRLNEDVLENVHNGAESFNEITVYEKERRHTIGEDAKEKPHTGRVHSVIVYNILGLTTTEDDRSKHNRNQKSPEYGGNDVKHNTTTKGGSTVQTNQSQISNSSNATKSQQPTSADKCRSSSPPSTRKQHNRVETRTTSCQGKSNNLTTTSPPNAREQREHRVIIPTTSDNNPQNIKTTSQSTTRTIPQGLENYTFSKNAFKEGCHRTPKETTRPQADNEIFSSPNIKSTETNNFETISGNVNKLISDEQNLTPSTKVTFNDSRGSVVVEQPDSKSRKRTNSGAYDNVTESKTSNPNTADNKLEPREIPGTVNKRPNTPPWPVENPTATETSAECQHQSEKN